MIRAPQAAAPAPGMPAAAFRTRCFSIQSATMSIERHETLEIAAEPPAAKRIPTERTFHGDTFTDEYAWLADKANPDTIAYLEAQNAYLEAMTASQAGLRNAIF